MTLHKQYKVVTMSVPKKRLNPTLRFGFFTSPAIKVILYQESLVKIAPTIAAAMAPNTAKPVTCVQKFVLPSYPGKLAECRMMVNGCCQLACHTSLLKANAKPQTIMPNSISSLIMV